MFLHRKVVLGAVVAGSLVSPGFANDFGRPATSDEIKLWDMDIRPDGKSLPEGSGTVAHGKVVYDENCQACHGPNGQGGVKDRLVGGQGTLASANPVKTVGSFWPYATTLFDYIHRAMPYQAPGSLSADDTYAVTAYILSLNGIVLEDRKLDKETLPKIKMPNRDGFIPDPEWSKFLRRAPRHERSQKFLTAGRPQLEVVPGTSQ
jgi:cytochrome c